MAEDFKGIYDIHEVDKATGQIIRQVMHKENHLTPQGLAWVKGAFSGIYNDPQSKDFCDGGAIMASSGVVAVDGIQQYSALRYLANTLALYGLSSTPADPTTLRRYPFLDEKLVVDDSQITFIGDDNTTGDKYAAKIPNPYFNLGGTLLSRSWKLTGPKGQGAVNTLCLGKAYHKPLSTNLTLSTDYWFNYPALIAEIVETGVVNDSGVTVQVNSWMQPNITGVTAANEILLGNGYVPYMKITFDSNGKGTKSRIDNTSDLRKFRMCRLGCGAIDMTTFYIGSDYNSTGFKCLVSDGTITSNYAYYYNPKNRFKKGADLLITNKIEFGYTKSSTSDYVMFHSASTGKNDSTTFGSYSMTYADMITNGKVVGLPTWFNFTGLGTRQDNGNWLLLDSYKCIVLECTDLLDVYHTIVDSYWSDTLTNIVINSTLYFVPSYPMSEFSFTTSDGLTGSGAQAKNLNTRNMQLRKATESTPMYSILTGVKDSNGLSIVQGTDTEYIFTFSIALGNPA